MRQTLDKLSAKAVSNAKGREKPYKLADGGGMYLLVNPDGSRYWRLKYRYDGKEKVLALGVYPRTTLQAARQARNDARKLLDAGTDPGRVRKQEKRQRKIRAENTLEAIGREWHDNQKARWKPGHATRVLESLESNLFPSLGEGPIADLTAPEILACLREIEKRGAQETALRVLQRTSAIFRYAIATGRATYNPAADLKGALKAPKRGQMAALKADELPELLRKIEGYDGSPVTKLGLKLLSLTFVRPGELRNAEWSEFDLEAREWRIPAERMKMKRPHLVPLSDQAIEILQAIQPVTGTFTHVLPGRNDPRKPMSENTLLYALYRLGYHTRMTSHGFRAVASTILHEAGFNPDVIERQLAHVERNKVKAAYNRSEYRAERTKMMQWWADYLDSIRDGGKVVRFKRSA